VERADHQSSGLGSRRCRRRVLRPIARPPPLTAKHEAGCDLIIAATCPPSTASILKATTKLARVCCSSASSKKPCSLLGCNRAQSRSSLEKCIVEFILSGGFKSPKLYGIEHEERPIWGLDTPLGICSLKLRDKVVSWLRDSGHVGGMGPFFLMLVSPVSPQNTKI